MFKDTVLDDKKYKFMMPVIDCDILYNKNGKIKKIKLLLSFKFAKMRYKIIETIHLSKGPKRNTIIHGYHQFTFFIIERDIFFNFV